MPKVLLVDADWENLVSLQKALTAAGYEVSVALSGSFALTMLEWDRPDVIVSLTENQDMDGYELCSIIRSDPATKDLPFLLLTGASGPVPGAAARVGSVDVSSVSFAWGAAVVLVLARAACKIGAVVALSHWAGLGVQRGSWVGITLLPMAALALVLTRDVVEAIPPLGRDVASIVLPAVIIMVVLGTLAAVWALRKAQETRGEQ